jgi:hypothetical protein
MSPRTGPSRRHLAASPFKTAPPAPVETFELDDRVTHDKYGLGRVTSVDNVTSVTVSFGAQSIRIPAPFTKLTKL